MDNIIYYINSILYIHKDLYKITIILSQEKNNKNVGRNLLNPMTLKFKFQRKITRDGFKNIFDFFATFRQPRKIG